jgi:hypothetical protein
VIVAAVVLTGQPAIATPTPTPAALDENPATAAGSALEGRQRVIVQLKVRADVAAVAGQQERAGGRIRHRYSRVLDGFAADLPPRLITALQRNPRVAAVTADAPTRASTTQSNPPWGLDRIDQHNASLDSTYSYESTGSGVTAYIVDSGIRVTHSDFGGRAVSGYDFVDGDTDASDCIGHGTHVAGTVGGREYGAAKDVRLVSLRVFGCDNRGLFSDTIAAFDWVVTNRPGPAVINYSGGGGQYQPMDEAVARATGAGVPVVVAAMNDNSDACNASPARAPAAITVGAIAQGDGRADFSNFGSCLDLFAPGVGVLSSTMDSDTSSGTKSGTSMATPHVAGAVARYLQTDPTASVQQVTADLQESVSTGVVTDSRSARDGLLFVAPSASVGVPGAPTGVTATAADASATVAWTAPATDGGAAISAYTITASPGGNTTSVAGTLRTATPTGLTNGTPYTFTVTATNSAGTSPPSTPSPAVTPTATGSALINETFTSSAANFTKISGGTWAVSGGRYVLSSPADAGAATANSNISVHKTVVTGDFTLTASASTTPTSSAFNDFSIIFGYRDPANYYFASFAESNDANTSGIFKVAGGVRTQLADITTGITAGTPYPIKIERQGATIRAYRSTTLAATATDSTFLTGKTGFGSRNDGGTFDDLRVVQ